jgi:hypothetical protein
MENQNTILYYKRVPKDRGVYEKMRKNMVEPGRPQNAI